MNLLRKFATNNHQLGELILGHFNLCFPDVGWRTLLGHVSLLVPLRVGLMGLTRPVVGLEGGVPPVADEAALMVSSDELPKGQGRITNSAGLLLFPSFQPC